MNDNICDLLGNFCNAGLFSGIFEIMLLPPSSTLSLSSLGTDGSPCFGVVGS